ncbi:uncharacterized protein LOC124209850 [Daphnia pulex]|uniref:uncharacterized protein LOC124209850 n=1 Tax=Daphnia pulex TaxID=6669 RepID=UPI001EE00B4F|nr:uncharacterized protein LOC124209850 [Daphnia pulex]
MGFDGMSTVAGSSRSLGIGREEHRVSLGKSEERNIRTDNCNSGAECSPACYSIVTSSIPRRVTENSTIHPDFSYNTTINTNSNSNYYEEEPNLSGNINASLSRNKSIEIEWTPLFPECIAYNSGVWIRVFESDTPSSAETYLSIPRKCLTEKYNSIFSFVIHSPTKSDDPKESDCHFELTNVLIECRSYKIELIPNYESLKGRPLTTEIVTPSTNGNSIDMKSLLSVATSSSSLSLNWKDNSGCATQLTSFNLKTFLDGKVNATEEVEPALEVSPHLSGPTEE